ncbi:saccharopine dehydrogenase family protein [Dyella flava]|uniref:Saccharopine dehydrogenase NADP-binding domain-containing protein n=1 Tax=Dyella flava TaxID=1920170 RepID=A0ABS2K2T8_9GAMM|nr:saccharopine dehydrogenase NADP-binding domain-containing protein [Dyella flava]MBM7125553.1 saccharopine dehydrogenase NADP-binding domain-containing protein [Dyella flava]GLQ51585.1 saccharopine dehydrogenase [Dyella flava]
MALRVLLIGATGVFGARIAARLAHDSRFELILAGRTRAGLEHLRDQLGDVLVRIAVIDVDAIDLLATLHSLAPQLVIHAAGPFQAQDYRVAEACLACHSDYVDLADGRDFVAGFAALDARARAAGRLLVSGASTLPALSSAVIDRLQAGFASLRSIEHAISPGNRTPRGDATVAAILGYCGRPVSIWQNGEWHRGYGWLSTRRASFMSGPRWVGLCDVPDLALFPQRYAGVQRVVFRAGLELRRLHFGMWLLAWLVRTGLLRDLPRHAHGLRRMSEWFLRTGTDAGGMVVELRGHDAAAKPIHLRWSLHATAGDGPQIPAMPAVVLARKLAAGSLDVTGAVPCMGLFNLDEALDALSAYAISTRLETLTA